MSFAQATNPVVVELTSRDTVLADTGNAYVANNPTAGTAITGPVSATLNQTQALLLVANTGNATIYPTALRLKLKNAGTGSVTVRMEHYVDTGNRFSSAAASNKLSPQNTNPLLQNNSGALIYFGNVTATAPNASRWVGSYQLRDVIGVVRDQYGFIWGSGNADLIQMPQTATNGTSEVDIVVTCPAIAIPPACSFLIHQWDASVSAGYQFEPVQFEYFEK